MVELTIRALALAWDQYLFVLDHDKDASFGAFVYERYGWGYPETDNEELRQRINPSSVYDRDIVVFRRLYEMAIQRNQLGLFPSAGDGCPG